MLNIEYFFTFIVNYLLNNWIVIIKNISSCFSHNFIIIIAVKYIYIYLSIGYIIRQFIILTAVFFEFFSIALKRQKCWSKYVSFVSTKFLNWLFKKEKVILLFTTFFKEVLNKNYNLKGMVSYACFQIFKKRFIRVASPN